jgi:hypothetical protein
MGFRQWVRRVVKRRSAATTSDLSLHVSIDYEMHSPITAAVAGKMLFPNGVDGSEHVNAAQAEYVALGMRALAQLEAMGARALIRNESFVANPLNEQICAQLRIVGMAQRALGVPVGWGFHYVDLGLVRGGDTPPMLIADVLYADRNGIHRVDHATAAQIPEQHLDAYAFAVLNETFLHQTFEGDGRPAEVWSSSRRDEVRQIVERMALEYGPFTEMAS